MKISTLVLSATFLLIANSCLQGGKCGDVACLPGGISLRFNLVDSSGRDLVFGAAARYNKDSLLLSWPENNNPNALRIAADSRSYNSPDSILFATYFSAAPIIYLKLSPADTDTLSLEYNRFDDLCCGPSYSLRTVRYNNGAAVNVGTDMVIFVK